VVSTPNCVAGSASSRGCVPLVRTHVIEPPDHVRAQHGVSSSMVDDRGTARAFWLRAPGYGEIRPVTLREPGPYDVLVRTLCSGISRGT
jgi:hypothetical protein